MKRILAASLLLITLSGCGGKSEPYSTDFFAMDTFMSVKVLGSDGESLAQQCENEINELESVLSRTRGDTDIAKLNAVYTGDYWRGGRRAGNAVGRGREAAEHGARAQRRDKRRIRPDGRAADRPLGHRHRASAGTGAERH